MVKEVDTVLTAGEIIELIKKAQEEKLIDIEFTDLLKRYSDPTYKENIQKYLHLEDYLLDNANPKETLAEKLKTNTLDKSNSHSYLEAVIRGALGAHFKVAEDQVTFSYKHGKNQDIEVIS